MVNIQTVYNDKRTASFSLVKSAWIFFRLSYPPFTGASATHFRFFPKIKRKYDYGVVIFILTFNMITVSGYRVQNIFRIAYERLSTIAIGSAICVVISLFVYPIWAGEDIHKSIIKKIQGLADSIEGEID